MFSDEEEKIARFRDLTEIMAKAPRQEPPEGFTAQIMARLPEGKATVRRFSFRRLFRTPVFTKDLTFGFRRPVEKTECAFYYILAGTFYLVMGLVLMVGLRGGNGEIALTPWSRIQPQLMIASAFWLSGLGAILYLSDRTKVEVAKIATVIYILLVFLSGAVMIMLYRMPVLMASTALFVISGVILGILLHQNISLYQKSLHH